MELKELNKELFEKIMSDFFNDYVLQEVEGVEICVLITKKSYCAYHLLKGDKKTDGITWYSDRYFTKCLDFTDFKGKKIAIIDDTINTAYNFRQFYKMMVRHCCDCGTEYSNIVPIACLMNEKYYTKWKEDGVIRTENEEEFDDLDHLFFESLKVCHHGEPDIVGKFSIFETKAFFENLMPYVVDLPIIRERSRDEENKTRKTSITISKDKFSEMIKGRSFWTFYPIQYDIVPGQPVNSGFFTFNSDFLYEVFGDFLQISTIRIQYKLHTESDRIRMYIVPYAEMRSIGLEELETCFNTLFGESQYGKNVNANNQEGKEDNYYVAMYRAIVYYVSLFTALQFIDNMGYSDDWEIDYGDQFTDDFISYMKDISKRNLNVWRSEMNWISADFSVPDMGDTAFSSDLMNERVNETDWSAAVYEQMIMHKRVKYNFTSEDFDNMMRKWMPQTRESERNIIITKILIEALDKSVICNNLEIDRKYGILKRGYRFGENSELIMPYDARIFYSAIYKFYYLTKKDYQTYMSAYNGFVSRLLDFFDERGILANMISPREFVFFARYFKNFKEYEFDTIILGKKYLLEKDCFHSSLEMENIMDSVGKYVESMQVEELLNV